MRKAQALPVDLVVKIIIGLAIFGAGFFLFQKIYNSSEGKVDNLGDNIRENIEGIGCDGSTQICVPTFDLRQGQVVESSVIVTNKGDMAGDFSITIAETLPISTMTTTTYSDNRLTKGDCGSILVFYYPEILEIEPQKSSRFPIQIEADGIRKRPCSFVTTLYLKQAGDPLPIDSTPLIINIK